MRQGIRARGLTVRLTTTERRRLGRAASRAGVTVGAFLRVCGLFFAERGDVRLVATLPAPPLAPDTPKEATP